MLTFDEFVKKVNVHVHQHKDAPEDEPIPQDVLAAQLELNGFLSEDVIERCFGRHKDCYISIFPTEHGLEAVVDHQPIKSLLSETAHPGFLVAREMKEVTIPQELFRAAHHVERKYTKWMGKILVSPWAYELSNVKIDTQQKEAIVEIASRPLNEFYTEQEYWRRHVKPKLVNQYSAGAALHSVDETLEHFSTLGKISPSNPSTSDTVRLWSCRAAHITLHALRRMMEKHGCKRVDFNEYQINKGTVLLPDMEWLVFEDIEVSKQVYGRKSPVRVNIAQYLKK